MLGTKQISPLFGKLIIKSRVRIHFQLEPSSGPALPECWAFSCSPSSFVQLGNGCCTEKKAACSRSSVPGRKKELENKPHCCQCWRQSFHFLCSLFQTLAVAQMLSELLGEVHGAREDFLWECKVTLY